MHEFRLCNIRIVWLYLRILEIVYLPCAISRLVCKLRISRLHYVISTLRNFQDCVEHNIPYCLAVKPCSLLSPSPSLRVNFLHRVIVPPLHPRRAAQASLRSAVHARVHVYRRVASGQQRRSSVLTKKSEKYDELKGTVAERTRKAVQAHYHGKRASVSRP